MNDDNDDSEVLAMTQNISKIVKIVDKKIWFENSQGEKRNELLMRRI